LPTNKNGLKKMMPLKNWAVIVTCDEGKRERERIESERVKELREREREMREREEREIDLKAFFLSS
jgi:hypothetical protein